ncbi:Serine hydroxymethyltransferase 4 [Zea mays]|uniref:Serine hydroxymethyltransferase 4 n=1 Tax=Zea mays TaxID=4577 RepID=A0A317Y8T6_MAIZE|nr:Serine hydroxymethyltransferase 4 [Zea mays]
MSCFVCFGSAAQDEEPKKLAVAGARKDATPDRAVARVGSDTAAGPGAGSRTRPLPPRTGIHREFSHRVKSVSMAKFTSQEVSALQEGGNELPNILFLPAAKEIYFKHWDLQGPVIDSSDVHRLRNFIKNVYVERRYSDQRIGEHLAQAKGNQDSYGNSNADSSPGVLRSAYVETYEDNHDLKRTKESLSENQYNLDGHPTAILSKLYLDCRRYYICFGKEAANPFEYCDVVTTTTHKSLRGPRAGMIFYRKGPKPPKKGQPEGAVYDYEDNINFVVFPSLQGGPHNHQIAALAVALQQTMSPGFKAYAKQVKANAVAIGNYLMSKGYKMVTDGTENHLVLWDLRPLGLTGNKVEKLCDLCLITLNKNAVFGDNSALSPGGVRIG